MKPRTLFALAILSFLLIISTVLPWKGVLGNASSTSDQSPYPTVYVFPNFTAASVNEIFNLSIVGFNFTPVTIVDPSNPTITHPLGNLYGFDIQLRWEPNVLEYVNHTVTVPVESYPAPNPPSPYPGALHNPVIEIKNEVNASAGTCWVAYASMDPAEPQNGNVTFLTITFRVKSVGESVIKLESVDLSDKNGEAIFFEKQDGLYRASGVPIVNFEYFPEVPVVNKEVAFRASVENNGTNIAVFMWDFGDGTKQNTSTPFTSHTYNVTGMKTTSLKVITLDGIVSGLVEKSFTVVALRDLKVAGISIPSSTIRVAPENIISLSATIENVGEADENCTLTAYYNVTNIDFNDVSSTTWVLFGTNTTFIPHSSPKSLMFHLNSTLLNVNASYYILINATGIPEGYEANTADNVLVSGGYIYATNVLVHRIDVTKLQYGAKVGTKIVDPPLISGETLTFATSLHNAGSDMDIVNITLLIDNLIIANEVNKAFMWGESLSFDWSASDIAIGNHSLTLSITAGDFRKDVTSPLYVVSPPQLKINFKPSTPVAGESVTLDASESIYADPNGNVTSWAWKIFSPGKDPSTSTPTATLSGVTVNYQFPSGGNWTIVLEITDSFGLKYEAKRSASAAYTAKGVISVGSAAGGPVLPPEYVIVIIALVVCVVIAIIVMRRRGKHRPSPTEVS